MRIFFSLKVLNNEAINFLKLLYINFCAVIPTLLKDINGISGVKEMEIACLLNETLSMTKNILKLSKYIVKECDAAVLNVNMKSFPYQFVLSIHLKLFELQFL